MIELKHLGKIYSSASGSVEALKDVNLTIADGEIFGIIGLSGAGKSTLVRCRTSWPSARRSCCRSGGRSA